MSLIVIGKVVTVVTNDGDFVLPFILPRCLTLNTVSYIKCWKGECCPVSIERLLEESESCNWSLRHVTHQQTLVMLSLNFCDHCPPYIWPPIFQNCNRLHYHVWGRVGRETKITMAN